MDVQSTTEPSIWSVVTAALLAVGGFIWHHVSKRDSSGRGERSEKRKEAAEVTTHSAYSEIVEQLRKEVKRLAAEVDDLARRYGLEVEARQKAEQERTLLRFRVTVLEEELSELKQNIA